MTPNDAGDDALRERATHLDVSDEVWRQLYAHARRQVLRFGHQQTLNATALVNEAWLKLAHGAGEWHSRAHFVATMARVMRHLLVDHVRARNAAKRGGDAPHVTVTTLADDAAGDAGESRVMDLLALDAALKDLRALDPRLELVAELRFFGGLSVEETAAALELSTATVKRDARAARAFLAMAIDG